MPQNPPTPALAFALGVAASCFSLSAPALSARAAEPPLPQGLQFTPGPVNAVLLTRDGKSLAVYGNPDLATPVDFVLLTHARRDVTWAARNLARRGAGVIAPEAEAEALNRPERFWQAWREKRFHDYAQQTTRVPVVSLPVQRAVKPGDTVEWGGLSIRVLATPGYTRGAVSYAVDLAGQRILFSGDLIRDDGKLPDLFSLQDAIPDAKIGGYHGWAGRLGEVMTSLDRLAAERPDLLVPARGPLIRDPLSAIRRLQERIRAVYANYLSIDALRWYFKDEHMAAKARRVLGPNVPIASMPMAETLALPPAIVAISNSRLLLAADGSGFLIDCGSTGIIDELRRLRTANRLRSLEHVFVTHYHDDHTDALPALVAEFGAQVHACGSLIDLIEHPGDYRLPCLTRNPTQITRPHSHRDSWRWKEYQLTLLDFPGQTLHHNALRVDSDAGWSAVFVGDSFTPSGIDDYCLPNRNFLHPGQGYFRCLAELNQLPPGCFLMNQHVEPAFRFSPAQIDQMRRTLEQRITLLQALLPFDDPNFGLDEGWAGLHPYWITLRPGASAPLALRVTNHSPQPQAFRTTLHALPGLRITPPDPKGTTLPPRADGTLTATVHAEANAQPGLHVVVADIQGAGLDLREWTEAIVEIVP